MSSRQMTAWIVAVCSVLIAFSLYYPELREGDYGWDCHPNGTCNDPEGFCVIEVNTKETLCTKGN